MQEVKKAKTPEQSDTESDDSEDDSDLTLFNPLVDRNVSKAAGESRGTERANANAGPGDDKAEAGPAGRVLRKRYPAWTLRGR